MKRLYRSIAILLCVSLCVTLCSCEAIDSLHRALTVGDTVETVVYTDVGTEAYLPPQDYTPIRRRYSYAALNGDRQALCEAIGEAVLHISPDAGDCGYPTAEIARGVRYTEADIALAVRAYLDDNPYCFWLSQTYTYADGDDGTTVCLYSAFSPEEVAAMKSKLDDALTAFYDSVPDGMTKYQREKYAHDYLIAACAYDEAASGITEPTRENLISHSAYGALVERLCVCEGYGAALQLMLNGIGVECVPLTGEAYDSSVKESEDEKVLHLWNAVKLDDGCWYHVDPTWDDQESPLQRYSYFNLSDRMIAADHSLSGMPDDLGEDQIGENGAAALNFFIPSCDATAYNYYIYELPHLTGYDPVMLDDSLYSAAESGSEYFTFYIEPTLGYDRAIEALFTEEQTFFDLIGRVNRRLDTVEIDRTNVVYYLNERNRAVSVALNLY